MTALDVMHRQAQARVRLATGAAVARMLAAVELDRSPTIRTGYATATSRLVNGGLWQAGQLALAYIAAYAPPQRDVNLTRALADRILTPESGGALVGLLRLWSLLDDGLDEAQARADAGTYAGGLAATDVGGAARDALDEAVEASGREPRWRLEAAPGACEWCTFIADTGARYLSADSVPVPHAPGGARPGGACGCVPAPEFD